MEGRAETQDAVPDAAGTIRLTAEPPGLAGWIAPDPLSPGEPPEVGLDVEGSSTCILTAGPECGPDGRYRLAWPLPSPLRDGTARRARAFHMISGLELEGSPLMLHAPVEAVQPDISHPAIAHPTMILAGIRPASPSIHIAEGLLGLAEEPAKTLRFTLLAEAGAPRRGIRLVADAVAPAIRLYFRLEDVVADQPMPWLVTAWLPEATQAQARARLDITLERREGPVFQTLRRLRRGSVYRRPSDHPVVLTLTAEEAMAAEGVWLGLCAQTAKGLAALLPTPDGPPLPEAARFEDARLDGTFAQAAEFLRAHGQAAAVAHPLLPGLWPAPPPPVIPARPAGGVHPFTQVILPIHNRHAQVKQCLHALRAAATGPVHVLMVDDGSSEFTAGMLRAEAAADPRFILHRRDVNRGYTKSINEGVLLTGGEWVVVLNSDTIVPSGWLDRLHAAARARPGTGMVGPLSNAATWQSLPAAKRPDGSWSTNDMIAPHHLARVQALLDQVSEREYPEFPLLNGFCTMIARAVFDRVGPYDEDAFPMGYGEETDLCLRARRAGFRLTLADDCFVYHHKSISFGQAARRHLSRAGTLEMTNKHSGVIVPALERMMQDCAPLGRLRARLSHLAAELA